MRTAEQQYREANESNATEVAYAVNNGQLSVRDLQADFDKSLLTEKKQTEFADFWEKDKKTEKIENEKTVTRPNTRPK